MIAIMLAAGEGTRCRPFTYLTPKLFQQVGGIPILEYMLSWFFGTTEISKLFLLVGEPAIAQTIDHYLEHRLQHGEDIFLAFKDLGYDTNIDNPDLEVESLVVKRWGTGGDLRIALDEIVSRGELSEDFLVCNADYLVERRHQDGRRSPQLDLASMIQYHRECRRALGTSATDALVSVDRQSATRFGVAQLGEERGFAVIRGFWEKPPIEMIPATAHANAGVYILDSDYIAPRVDELLPRKPGTDLERTLLEPMANQAEAKLAGYTLDLHTWFDVGTLHQLVGANMYVASQKGASPWREY